MSEPKVGSVKSFGVPTQLPDTEEQAKAWQAANRAWWEANPMRYDWRTPIEGPEFSAAFYAEIDRRFFSSAEMKRTGTKSYIRKKRFMDRS